MNKILVFGEQKFGQKEHNLPTLEEITSIGGTQIIIH
jgi:hypothetical protein